jgi:hypothetical protein
VMKPGPMAEVAIRKTAAVSEARREGRASATDVGGLLRDGVIIARHVARDSRC